MLFKKITVSALALAQGLALSACDAQDSTAAPSAAQASSPAAAPVEAGDLAANHSWQRAREEVAARLAAQPRPQRAQNVILFIADGMNIDTITAARIFDGQSRGESGVENRLSFETFPNSAFVRTYDATNQVPDSASTATALVTGVKARISSLSVMPDQYLDACEADAVVPHTLMELAEMRGLSTGVVSTARITHATPASTYAHSIFRDWENDSVMPAEAVEAGCVDIASQLIAFDTGDGMELALGGGRANFLPTEAGGRRADGRDLTAEWEAAGGTYVSDAAGLRALDATSGSRVLGLFNNSHMSYQADRSDAEEPSLAELTAFAIDRLATDEDGYFLMVEAGRVDHAHHGTNAYRALTDMQAYSEAIATALEHVDLDNTLILVTADHGHTFNISGYPMRDNPILGLVRVRNPMEPGSEPQLVMDSHGHPYTTLGYQNGPNIRELDSEELTDEVVLDPNYQQQTAVPLGSETHSGADVPLFANGPRAHYFDGSMEQNTVFHLIVEAYGWGVEE